MKYLIPLFLSIASVLIAQEDLAPKIPLADPSILKEDSADHFMGEFLNMLFMLGMLLLGLLVVTWILKRVVNTRMDQLNATSAIKVLERRAIAPRVNIYVVEIEGTKLILGETPSGLTRLGDLSDGK